MSMMRGVVAPHRRQALWWAFMVHRVSGLLLALFLPFHFLALGLALNGEAAFDEFIIWTEHPLVKLVETGLFLLLSVHLTGGLRLLALELLAWRSSQKNAAAFAVGMALAGAMIFFGVAW